MVEKNTKKPKFDRDGRNKRENRMVEKVEKKQEASKQTTIQN